MPLQASIAILYTKLHQFHNVGRFILVTNTKKVFRKHFFRQGIEPKNILIVWFHSNKQ